MSNNGIMEEIRNHLAHGKSSRELIDLGYRPGSVYGALRQMSQKSALKGMRTQRQLQRETSTAASEEDGLPEWPVWHADPPRICPGCKQKVVHWEVCPHCSRLMPMGCACTEDSVPAEGYALSELPLSVTG